MDILGSGELIFSSGEDIGILRGIARQYRSKMSYRANNLSFDEWVERMQEMLVESTLRGDFGTPTSSAELELLMNEAESSTIETRQLHEVEVEDDPDPVRDVRTKRFFRYLASYGETIYILPPKWTAAVLLGSFLISGSLEDARGRLAAARLVDYLKVGSEEQQRDVKTEVQVHEHFVQEGTHAAGIYEQLVEHYNLAARHYQ